MDYNTLNRLSAYKDTQQGSAWRDLSYDNRGNVTDNYALSSQGLGFVYDMANQPVEMNKTISGDYVYDGNFKRVKQVVDGTTTYSFYSQSGALLLIDNISNTAEDHDYYHLNGALVLTIKGSDSSYTEEYQHTDHLGSPVAATNNAGNVVWRENFTPYGEKRVNPSQNEDSISYTGHVTDSSGLVYMQARYYDPVIGRFYSNDPVGFTGDITTFNRYSYVGNNPYSYIDPDGTTRYKFDFSFKVALGKGLGAGVSFTVDTESLEISAGAGGTLRTGAAAGFELSLGSEPSSTRGNSAVLEGTADLTLGGGEESVKIEGKLDSANGLTGDVKLESALKIDGNGLNLNPQLGISAGVGGKGEVNLSIPETLQNTKQAISEFSKGLSNALKSCAESPGTAC